MPIRLRSIAALWPLVPLLVGCPGGAGGEDAADATTNDPTVADDTSSAAETDPSLETETDPPPDTETDTAPSDTDSDTDAETDTAPPETDTDVGEPIAGCECILDEEPVDTCSLPTPPTCGDAICPLVSGGCTAGSCPGDFELDDAAALECALLALRDRTPGLLTWTYSDEGELLTEDGYLLIREDGTAVRRTGTRQDFNIQVVDATLGELPLSESFDACLADPGDLARFDCMRAAFETQLEVCDAGWYNPDCV